MSALDELSVQCERHGWRLGLTGTAEAGILQEGLVVDGLEVRAFRSRELLARVTVDGSLPNLWLQLEQAAVSVAYSLESQGLIRG